MPVVYIILGLAAFGVFAYITAYNALVQLNQKVKEAWSGIDVQLKRRYDLIPNLINTVKGYASHESGTLEKVTKARAEAIAVPDGKIAQQAEAENALSGTLKSIFALSENYPDLKANQNFLQLQTELSETEDQIASSRRIYNGNVSIFNTKVQSFPSNIVAGVHNFAIKEFFETEDKEAIKVAPVVQF